MIMALYVLGGIVAIYLIGMYVGLRLVVPFMGFRQYKAPTDLPQPYLDLIRQWEAESKDPMEFLKRAYDFVLTRWNCAPFKTVTSFPKIFRKDLNRLWNEPGYMHCNTMNFVLHTLLVNSKFFRPEDVKVRHTVLNYVQHQYIKVNVGDRWVEADPGGSHTRGLKLGERTGLF
jgi:hypothetical protein